MMNLYKKIILFLVLVLLVLAALPFVATADKAPTPPVFDYRMIDIPGAEPAECAGQPGCTTMCFYIREDSDAVYHWELSCLGMIIQE